MQKNKLLRKAAILLIATTFIFSSTAAIANTTHKEINKTLFVNDYLRAESSTNTRDTIYDNGMGELVGMLAAQDERPVGGDLDAFPADDFILDTAAIIEEVHWQGGYYNCQYAQGAKDYEFDWNVTFYNDNGTGAAPGDVLQEFHFPNDTINVEFWYNTTDPSTGRETWYANYSVTLPNPIQLNAGVKYWMGVYGINLTFPQAGWCRHNESVLGIKFNEAVFKSEYFGFPDWTKTTDLVGEANDFNFVLAGQEIDAPALDVELKGGIGVTATITNTGNADATNVEAQFTIAGGLVIIPSGGSKSVSVGTISKEGGTGTAKCFILGFGTPTITVDVTCDEGVTATANLAPKLVFLFFVL